MKTRQLGRGLNVSAIGYGCMGLSGTYGQIDAPAAISLLRHAVDQGVSFFDTADAYGPFRNEELVGEALRPVRDRVIIATKFGQEFLSDGGRRINGRPDYVRSACEASLKRLGIDCIDLYFVHRIDRTVPIEETVGEMGRLAAEGKVRHIGLSEASAETIRRAHAVHPLAAVQTEYSLWTRDVEAKVLPTLRELGIGFIAYSPLGTGLSDWEDRIAGGSRGGRRSTGHAPIPEREPGRQPGNRPTRRTHRGKKARDSSATGSRLGFVSWRRHRANPRNPTRCGA